MALSSRTFRVFVSSTFEDLVEERDVLQRQVFPALQEFCLARGARFQAIDLRWGVSEQASIDQRAINICLAEIARCRNISPRPNFIVLLGDRYGWCPPPSEIPATEFNQIRERVADGADRQLLDAWYGRDDNAVAPVHYLRRREGRMAEYSAWAPIERRLRAVIEAAVRGTNLAYQPRYVASATEQEIVSGALTVPDASEHVFCFLRAIYGLPLDGGARSFTDLRHDGTRNTQAQARLENLKDRLRSALPGNVFEYRADWRHGRPSGDHVKHLAADVQTALMRVISAELERLQDVDPLEHEIQRHTEFGAERRSDFVGREGILAQIAHYLDTGPRRPLAIHGESGAGKSALIAQATANAQRDHPAAVVVVRFVGTTPESSSGQELLSGLCRQIVRAYGVRPELVNDEQRQLLDESTLPSQFHELAVEFSKRLTLASPQRPVLIFIDALDQLPEGDPARQLLWLPTELPDGVRIVVSTTRPQDLARLEVGIAPNEPYAAVQSRLPAEQLIPLERMHESEGTVLLDTWLARAHRRLQPHQRQQVIEKFELEGLPLYLKLAFEQARLWRSDTPSDLTDLAIGIRGVIRANLFARLGSERQHGATLVSHSLGYLAAAKNGLSEDELLDLLSSDAEVLGDFRQRSPKSPAAHQLPTIVWSRLYFDLEPYLAERAADGASLLSFYHRQLQEVVEEDYLDGEIGIERHRQLAAYFSDDTTQPLERRADDTVTPNRRRLSELPYQQTTGKQWDEIFRTLTDFHFLEVKAEHGGVIETGVARGAARRIHTGVYQLQSDYGLLLRRPTRFGPSDSRALVVTAVDLGDGLKLRCPHCNQSSDFCTRWRGRAIACPRCDAPLTVNTFTVTRVGSADTDREAR